VEGMAQWYAAKKFPNGKEKGWRVIKGIVIEYRI
jgi:hypothetical protein